MKICDLCGADDIFLLWVTPEAFRLAVEHGLEPPTRRDLSVADLTRRVIREGLDVRKNDFERLRQASAARSDDWGLCGNCRSKVARVLEGVRLPDEWVRSEKREAKP